MNLSEGEARTSVPHFREGALPSVPRLGQRPAFTVLRRLVTSSKGLLGTAIIGILLLVALLAPWIIPHDAFRQQLPLTLAPPTLEHPFGNDHLGRDILSRVILGSQLSLAVGILPSVGAALIGVPLGLLAGFSNNLLSVLISRFADIVLSFPGILVAITLAALIGPGLTTVGLGILIFLVPGYVRIVYAEVLYLREREFVLAAHALGASSFRILLRHVLPNAAAPIIVQLTLNMATAVLSAASLSYLGLGAQPPTPEWGAMISEGQQHLRNAPHVVTFPGLAILALVLGFSLLGDALHDALDPILSHAA